MTQIMTDQDTVLSGEIEQALKNGEIKAFYQPQYDAVTGKLVSAEALARWVRADGSVVPPVKFIPCAECSDLILEIDWHMLHEVCGFLKKSLEKGLHVVSVAVNFSRRHIDEKDFRQKLCEIVDSYGVKRSLIELELTESAMMDNSQTIVELIAQIRDDGFSVAIDDFGSGLSSLSLVKDISANILKIDKSLLSGNCENEKERVVLESIFNFAHRLKLTTIAEGVETREQLGFLRTCDCRLIQGFLFAKPMPEDEFAVVCAQRSMEDYNEDILLTQAPASVTDLLMEVVFEKFPLVILSNLSRNSFYMMAYEHFTAKSCPSTGVFSELIEHGASTMHPEDQELFRTTFSIENLMKAYESGEKFVKIVTRQMGDDGVYRRVETTDFFVKNPAVDDVLVITLCQNLE